MPKPTQPDRSVLTDFLKSRRSRLRPEDVGLPVSRRRRLRGLRREEVAALAGVGDTWYGLFESGKRIRVSRELVESVGTALHLTDDERRYLHSLVIDDPETEIDFETDPADALTIATLDALATVPAFVIGPRLDYLAVNAIGRALYRHGRTAPPSFDNLALRLFLDPDAGQIYPDWERSAQLCVSKLRRNYGNHVGNASFERLIASLRAESTPFRMLWQLHEVAPPDDPVSDAIGLPDGTRFSYRLQSYHVAGAREQSLVVMHPLTAADAAALTRLVASWA